MTEHKDEQNLEKDLDFDFNFDEDELVLNDQEEKNPQVVNDGSNDKNHKRKMMLLSRIPITMTLELASVEISLAEVMSINSDSIIELDKLAGEPLDVKVNGILFGKAEVVVVNDKYGLQLVEFNTQDFSELLS